ncbi:MAG TPA: hypothetical protein VN030_00970 [Cellvibrio sp.]|nr:hypothetical protein [Cellvibrio sp.]
MKMKQKLVAGAAVLSALAGFTVPAAHADVAATVGASNMYYWRGFDLGGGAAVSADVNVSAAGFIAGIWTSSGDATLGTEYDLYAGYSGSAGDFSYGLSVVSYNYANPKGSYDHDDNKLTAQIPLDPVSPGEYVEVVPFVGFGPFKLTYYDAVAAEHPSFSEDYSYVTAELNFEKFGIKYGQHMLKDGGDESLDSVAHLDVTYKYNSKLSFTIGQVVEDNDYAADETNFIVNLSLPLE